MPFTATHVLAVLPIWLSVHRQLPIAALAIGAMIPDFPLFYPVSTYDVAHSFQGLLLYCLPAGLLVFFLFEWVVKQFLIDCAPEVIRYKLSVYRSQTLQWDFFGLIKIAVALVVGALTHIVWDAFTHAYGWGVAMAPSLMNEVLLGGMNVPYYKLFQYGSSVIGIPVMLVWMWYLLPSGLPQQGLSAGHVGIRALVVIVLSFLMLGLVMAVHSYVSSTSLYVIVGKFLIGVIRWGLVMLLVFAVLYRFFPYLFGDQGRGFPPSRE